MTTPAVYLVGSSGTGKSTLAKALADRLGWKYVPLSAGAAYARHGTTFAAAEADPVLLRKVQSDICCDAAATVREAVTAGAPFVTDRAIDYAAYTALMCDYTPAAHGAVESLRAAMTAPAAIVLFCRPVPAITEAARATDAARSGLAGGGRSKFLADEWVTRVDAAVLALLRHRRVPFAEITAADPADRLAVAVAAVKLRCPDAGV